MGKLVPLGTTESVSRSGGVHRKVSRCLNFLSRPLPVNHSFHSDSPPNSPEGTFPKRIQPVDEAGRFTANLEWFSSYITSIHYRVAILNSVTTFAHRLVLVVNSWRGFWFCDFRNSFAIFNLGR